MIQWFVGGVVVVSAFVVGLSLGYVLHTAQPRFASVFAPAAEPVPDKPPSPVAEATGTVAHDATSPQTLLQGVPEVIDTVTLRLGGSTIRLYGLEWVQGGKAEDLSAYLRGRPVWCLKKADPNVYGCKVGRI